jgi:hypothetical protein
MEAHFINRQGTKKDIKIWEDKDSLKDDSLYYILSANQ